MIFRQARRGDVPTIVALLSDDVLGSSREDAPMERYLAAFETMKTEGGNRLIVGEDKRGDIVATYQLTFMSSLSLAGKRRAQVEAVRVASHCRGQGIGQAMFTDAEARARAAGCELMQLTMNASRAESRKFYEGLGFEASHVGLKKPL